MKNDWLFFTNMDHDGGCRHILSIESRLSQGFGLSLLPHFTSLVDNSFYQYIRVSGNSAFQDAFSHLNNFAGALYVWISRGSRQKIFNGLPHTAFGFGCGGYQSQTKHATSCIQNLAGLHFSSHSKVERSIQALLAQLASFTHRRLWKEVEQHSSSDILSLAAVTIPQFNTLSSKVLVESIAGGDSNVRLNGSTDCSSKENYQGCASLAISKIRAAGEAIEPKTGIKFPAFIEDNSNVTAEVLVGTGSRTMRIMKVKSLEVYAFGLYIRPNSLCERLGSKYASVPTSELKSQPEFYEDLLREDIHMTVRLVVNCNRLNINTVRDAFEKSLRTRLQKMNPDTDYHCLGTFGSYFNEDIRIPVGTTIDFRQTAAGQLITEINGKHIGAVYSKDLCRAFFDMYIGDAPVSMQAKQDIAENVAGLISRC